MDYTYAYLRRAQLDERLIDADLQRRDRRSVMARRLSQRAERAAQRARLAVDRAL